MPFLQSIIFVVLLAFIGVAAAKLHSTVPGRNEALFQKFKSDHKKSYGSSNEEAKKYSIFVQNLQLADARNLLDPGVHGITRFTDISQAEFEATYLTLKPGKKAMDLAGLLSPSSDRLGDGIGGGSSNGRLSTASGSQDWTGIYTTPIKNQGGCGRYSKIRISFIANSFRKDRMYK